MRGGRLECEGRATWRAEEHALVGELVADLASGASGSLLVEGPWGSGKSALARVAAELAVHSGCHVARARGASLERAHRFGLVGQLLPGVAPPARTDDPAHEAIVCADFHRAVGRLATRAPVLLCIDDLELADVASLRALAYLLTRLDTLAVAVVATVGPSHDDDVAKLRHVFHERHDGCAVLLEPLSAQVTASALRDVRPEADDESCEVLHGLCAGSARVLDACVRSPEIRGAAELSGVLDELLASPPMAVERGVSALLQRLGDDTRRLAEALASAHAAPLPIVRSVARLHPRAADDSLDLLDANAMLTPAQDGFASEIVRRAVVRAMPAAARDRLHLDFARALGARGAAPAAVAAHLLDVRPRGAAWVTGALRTAGRDASRDGAWSEAIVFLRRALDEGPLAGSRGALLADLARAEAALGDDRAVAHACDAVGLIDVPIERADLLLTVGRALLAAGHSRAAARAFERGLSMRAGSDRHHLFAAGLVAATRVHPDLRLRVRDRVPALLDGDASRRSDAARAVAAQRAFEMILRNEPAIAVAAVARTALPPDGRALPEPLDAGLLDGSGALVLSGDVGPALASLERAIACVDAETDPFAAAALHHRRAQCRFATGRLDAARRDLETALEDRGYGESLFAPAARGLLAVVLLAQDDVAAALQLVGPDTCDDSRDDDAFTAVVVDAHARVQLALGHVVAARAGFERAGSMATSVFDCENPALLGWRSGAALAAHRMGEAAAAQQLANDELRAARAFGEPRSLARALRVSGLVRGGPDGLAQLREAVATVAGTPAGLEHARSAATLGGALRRARQLPEAVEHLRVAADLASRVGAHAISRSVADDLRLAGARPRRARATGPDALTPGEARVVALARDGATNREIALQLFVSVKAVEFHLRNAFRKLGVSSRRDLASIEVSPQP